VASVCRAHLFYLGKEEHHPLDNRWFVKVRNNDDKHTREHLNVWGPEIDRALDTLGYTTNSWTMRRNDVQTPCTCSAMLYEACICRHRVLEIDRPWNIDPRYAAGYRNEVSALSRDLSNLLGRQSKLQDWRNGWLDFSGPAREMYRVATVDMEVNGYTQQLFFDLAGKWGEKAEFIRGRVIAPQAMRCIGSEAVGGSKPGRITLGPILQERPFRKKFEEALHKLRNRDGSRAVASGRTLVQRAKDIINMFEDGWITKNEFEEARAEFDADDAPQQKRQKMMPQHSVSYVAPDHGEDIHILSFDFTSFDGSLGKLAVWERDAFYVEMVRLYGEKKCANLKRTLDHQNVINGKGKAMETNIYGNRASGTAGTSTGNKIVVIAALRFALGPGFKHIKIYCDGDDTLLFIPDRYMPFVQSWRDRLGRLGLTSKIENHAKHWRDIVFCRAKIVLATRGRTVPILCKQPDAAIVSSTNIVRHFRGNEFSTYLHTLRECGEIAYEGVPILHALGRLFPRGKADMSKLGCGHEFILAREAKQRQGKVFIPSTPDEDQAVSQLISDEVRHAFYLSHGVTPAKQIEIERDFSALGDRLEPLFLTRDKWLFNNWFDVSADRGVKNKPNRLFPELD